MTELIVVGALAFTAVLFLRAALRVVPQAHVMIIERMGRYHRTLQSGLSLVVPLIDKPSPRLRPGMTVNMSIPIATATDARDRSFE